MKSSCTQRTPAPPQAAPRDKGPALVTHMVPLGGDNPEVTRAKILDYFHNTFSTYESLFECLNGDAAFTARANPLRHPLIFYYGHTAVFFMNKLNVAGAITERLDPKMESMLAIGVDEMSWDDLDEKNYHWPKPAEVKAYRDKVRAAVDKFIRTADLTLPVSWESPFWIVMMGIEHERIHLETSAVLIRELPLQHVKPHAVWGRLCRESGAAPQNELLPVKGGEITLGQTREEPYYGWDNEYGHQAETVKDFKASKFLVSNREYLAFVEEGGYSTQKYWTDEGWRWANFRKAQHPVFWVRQGDTYKYRAMLEVIDMPWNWPVDVNQLEAKAFCNWMAEKTGKNIRLPSEAEWHALARNIQQEQPEWTKAPGNINLEHYMSACPVDKFAFDGGFYDIIGNAWQWTETPIDGFEGFEVHPAYDDFSTPTFDGRHNIFKGGCWISTGNYALTTARYAFRRHFFQNSGIRYVEGEDVSLPEPNVYETDGIVSQYIEFHYGDEYYGVPNFAKACAELCLKFTDGGKRDRALDIGCATGRSSFELAREFAHVDAIDFSARLIQMPARLQAVGRQRYIVHDEGELVTYKEFVADTLNLGDKINNVSFMQGDACNLAAKYTGYDLIFAGNLIDRLYDPEKFLKMIPSRLNAGGTLILASPYTWLAEFTERPKWIGGFKAPTGESFTTLDGLKKILGDQFVLQHTLDVPFVIRETRRKFQHTLSEMSVWKKK